MPSQTYANHAHRPAMTAVALLFAVAALTGFVMWLRSGHVPWTLATGIGGLIGAVVVLSSISRVYTTRLQDRIIRVEMLMRAAGLLSPAQQVALRGLDLRRIAALRFASDDELPTLLDRAVRESLTPDQIKRAIRTWVPDFNRT